MRQMNVDRKTKDHLQPWQVFDLIGGTSTGGIIAFMLGSLQMSVDECYDVYMQLATTIFKPKRWRCDVFNRTLDALSANERYDSAKMEELVKQIIKERTGSRNTMLQDTARASRCKVFVTTVRAADEQLILLRTYQNTARADPYSSTFEMWEALRATSAASTYFKPHRQGTVRYLDGAFKSNNPIFEVHHEASDLWPEREVCMVSIGTGTKPNTPLGGHVVQLARSMTKLATATEGSWVRFHRTHKVLAEQNRLFRFSAPGVGIVDLGDSKKLGDVAMRTEGYLQETSTARDVAACSEEMSKIETKEYTTVLKLSNNEQDCLKLLSHAGGPYESHMLGIEKPVSGTCRWLLEHDGFTNWLKSPSSALLWLTANPGCGKTVLSSFLVDVLSRKSHKATVCHFFFKAGEDSRQNSNQALCAILHQVFKAHPQSIKSAMDAYSVNDAGQFTLNIETLWDILCKAADYLPTKEIICVVDALDECGETSRDRFIDLLVKTYPQMVGSRKILGKLKIIVTSRPWPAIESRFQYLSCIRLRGENESLSLSKDIEKMVNAKVSKLEKAGVLTAEASVTLQATLSQKADGTFLWAALVLETISRLPSRKLSAIKSSLEVIPDDLGQLYQAALSSFENPVASTVFKLEILEMLLDRGAGGYEEAMLTAAETGSCDSLRLLMSSNGGENEEVQCRSRKAALKAASEAGRALARRVILAAGVEEPEGTDLSKGLVMAASCGFSTEDLTALMEDGARDDNGEALLWRATFGEPEGVRTLLSMLEYPRDTLDEALFRFFDTNLSADTRGYLLKTIESALSSGSRRLWEGFAIKAMIGQCPDKNEAFLSLLTTKNARLPTASKEEFNKAIAKDAVIVDAFATWCGPCKAIAPILANLSNDPDHAGLYFIKIDVDEVPDLSQELGIRAMPTFLIFKKGEKAQEIVGANPTALKQVIVELAKEFPAPTAASAPEASS
ncbi:Thioredoxin [Colletotrichum sidae]|uniref:Thioredoxin n=1 Tax=Colletotrichum sidae TaxID=1347389 RepID=A0A4R8TGA7_9PEZI|nr:Thioredoxin [Colletotrichum sidae]